VLDWHVNLSKNLISLAGFNTIQHHILITRYWVVASF